MNLPNSDSQLPIDVSADFSILGFKYQLRYSLLVLFEAQRIHGLDVGIDIERIDDIDVQAAGKLTKLVQTKHTATVLTNSSAPFWKTIRIWSEAIRNGTVDTNKIQEFLLVATSPNPDEDSAIVNQLQQKSPAATATALEAMRALAAAKRQQVALGRAYQAFYDLTPLQQQSLVQKIAVQTNAPSFDDLDRMIQQNIVHGPPDKREAFSRVLFAHWDLLIEEYLRTKVRSTIGWDQLQSLLQDISQQFHDDNLPVNFADMIRDAFPALSDDSRLFMRQLVAIRATDRQRQSAQRLLLRSTQLLAFWQRKVLVRPDEVASHSSRLSSECAQQHEMAENARLFLRRHKLG